MNFGRFSATPANAVGLACGRIDRGLAQAGTAMPKIVMHRIIAVQSRAISPAAPRSMIEDVTSARKTLPRLACSSRVAERAPV
jgi:hypothetical protein